MSTSSCVRVQETGVPFRVLLDGAIRPEPPMGWTWTRRARARSSSRGSISWSASTDSITDRTFEITFHSAGVEAYVFTFG